MNNKIIGVTEVAKLLNLSPSTVRRLSDNATLPSFKIQNTGYRKFNLDDVLTYKKTYKKSVSKKEETNTIIQKNIVPKAHPKHYLMHRYWGRKAHNVISEYINAFTSENDTILDPFMGSGTTIIESLKNNRNVIGVDLNPMSIFITKNTITDVDLKAFEKTFKKIYINVFEKYNYLYETQCPICNKISTIKIEVWENAKLLKIRGNCPTHKKFIIEPRQNDILKINEIITTFNSLNENLNYPKDTILKYVRRSGKETINELFSERALLILSELRTEISKVSDTTIKSLLEMCFTSMLPNVSKMIPGDIDNCTYKSGWVVSKFWVPSVHTERNIFDCFKLRFNTIKKGKEELLGLLNSSKAQLFNNDSRNLSFITDSSIDYIFTDPPYGESIAYFALSQFWNTWLDNTVEYENEIIIDSYRSKNHINYDKDMLAVFKELYRVLKPNHYLSFTFHNRDLNVWKAVLDNCILSGFTLVNVIMQDQAVSSGTQGLNKENTLKGDFIYNFKKTDKHNIKPECKNSETLILKHLDKKIKETDGATSSELYEYIIPIIAENRAYYNTDNQIINLENLLNKNYIYIKDTINEVYKWTIK